MGGLNLLKQAREAGLEVYRDGNILRVQGPRKHKKLALGLIKQKASVFEAMKKERETTDRTDRHVSPLQAYLPRPDLNKHWPDLYRRVHDLTYEDLPAAPFALGQGATVLDKKAFMTRLKMDLAQGPHGPRALYGALQGDCEKILEIVQRRRETPEKKQEVQ